MNAHKKKLRLRVAEMAMGRRFFNEEEEKKYLDRMFGRKNNQTK